MISSLQKLRKKHPRFIYRSYTIIREGNSLGIRLKFETEPDFYFSPLISVKNFPSSGQLDINLLKNLAFHLGLMEIFTYWKATCSPEIVIEAGGLNAEQTRWWKNFLVEGLGQFYFTNNIDFRDENLVKITVKASSPLLPPLPWPKNKKILVPLGGGKDSALTLELAKKAGYKVFPFIYTTFAPIAAAFAVADTFSPKAPIEVRREIDPLLLKLNEKGYLNGHVPIVAHIMFASLLAAFLTGCQKIAFGNEASAEEGNGKFLGKIINHQYDKSWEFEKNISSYLKQFISPEVELFSFLRPLYELQISKLFSHFPRYFSVFRSCNPGQKTNSWCGQCPKCLSVYALLSPFLPKNRLLAIFKKDLLKDQKLIPLAKQLIGEEKFKPLECVGTYKETKIAFWLSLQRLEREKAKLPAVLVWFKSEIVPKEKNWAEKATRLLNFWNPHHHLPRDLELALKSKVDKNV